MLSLLPRHGPLGRRTVPGWDCRKSLNVTLVEPKLTTASLRPRRTRRLLASEVSACTHCNPETGLGRRVLRPGYGPTGKSRSRGLCTVGRLGAVLHQSAQQGPSRRLFTGPDGSGEDFRVGENRLAIGRDQTERIRSPRCRGCRSSSRRSLPVRPRAVGGWTPRAPGRCRPCRSRPAGRRILKREMWISWAFSGSALLERHGGGLIAQVVVVGHHESPVALQRHHRRAVSLKDRPLQSADNVEQQALAVLVHVSGHFPPADCPGSLKSW